MGGISGKWKRRYIGSAFLTLSIIGFSLWTSHFSWYYLLILPLLCASTSIGYGADKLPNKLFKRFYCGVTYIIATLPVFIVGHHWGMLAFHTMFCLGSSIYLGSINPYDNARMEESAIAFSVAFIPLTLV